MIFEDSNGEIDEIFEEDLPYDLSQDPIVLDNQGYGIWYLDSMDHLERYVGKNIQFLAMVLKPEEYPDGYFVPGRMAMTCCAEDMAFLGYACEYAGTKDLKQKEWVKVTAKVAKEYFADYKGEGPVLHAISVEKAKAPKDPVISLIRKDQLYEKESHKERPAGDNSRKSDISFPAVFVYRGHVISVLDGMLSGAGIPVGYAGLCE